MESILQPPRPFLFENNIVNVTSGNLRKDWEKWKKSYKIYQGACELTKKEPIVQINILLHVIGEKCRDVYEQFGCECKTVEQVLTKFDEFFLPKQNLTIVRHKFFTREQGPSESVEQYAFELNKMAGKCEFKDLSKDLVRDRLICGVKDGALRERLLREPDLTLEKAVEICNLAEMSRAQAITLKSENEEYHVNELKNSGEELHTEEKEINYIRKQNKRESLRAQPPRRPWGRGARAKGSRAGPSRQQHEHPSQEYNSRDRDPRSHQDSRTWSYTPTNRGCMQCGNVHRKFNCPAFGQQCVRCKRMNHYSRMCRVYEVCEESSDQVATSRLPLPTFSPRAVLMYSAAVGGEGAVALQLREAAPGELDGRLLRDERLAIACHEPELLADLLHAAGAADVDGEHGLSALLGASSPDLLASDGSDSLPPPDHDDYNMSVKRKPLPPPRGRGRAVTSSKLLRDHDERTSSSPVASTVTTVSVAVAGLDRSPAAKKVRPKPCSPNRQGPQQCQVCNKIFGNASALAKHKLTHSDERKYVCITCAKAFKRQDHLNGHMLTHRNKKPYECKAEGCGKSYCDARSLRRHTENHHQSSGTKSLPSSESSQSVIKNRSNSTSASAPSGERESSRLTSPASPPRSYPPHSDSSNGSEKSSSSRSGSRGDSSPPSTPPAPATPPARPRPAKATAAKPKPAAQQGSQKCGSATSGGGSGSGATSGAGGAVSARPDVKPVECNLCHRKFKNIPALNGHMRLHGGYFKKDSDSKKLDKKESTGPPLQTASVSVRALIEEKIISRRGAIVTPTSGSSETGARAGFATPAPPPPTRAAASPASPAAAPQFVPPRAPSAAATATAAANATAAQRDSTLIELLKRGNSKVVKRSTSDPGHSSPQQEFTFRPEMFGVSFNSDDGYFSPALNEDTFQFTTTPEHLEDLASLEDYATVAASIRERSPVTFPSSRRLAAVLNSPLPESLADFGACHGGSPVPSPGIGYSANSPGLSYSTGDSPGLPYTATSPGGSYSTQPEPSPGLAYPTPPASHDAHSPAHTVPRASSPLSAAFFTATMSSQEEVEEALEEVLPEECRSLDAYTLDSTPMPRRIMLNSEDPLLSSSPRDFSHQRPPRRYHRLPSTSSLTNAVHQWQHEASSLQVCIEGRDTVPAVFLSPSSVPASPQRRKRRAAPAGPYRSRMRRNLQHYTPQPLLPPDREGPGLFVELTAGLPAMETDMLTQLEEPQQPTINIGQDHQADIPEMCNDRIDLHRASEQLLWDPGINDALDDNEVRMFMELAMCAAMPVGGHTREFALQTLGECGGDVRAATLRLMSRPAAPAQHESRWAPDEVEAFLAGLRHYDKDFCRISQLIRTKDSKQCIQFYYFWKKVTKDYKMLYLRSWNMEQFPTQGSVGPAPVASAAASPAPFEGEEFPCKICGKVFNKVKSRSAHMKSHRPLDAEPKRSKLEKPYEKVERSDDKPATADYPCTLPAPAPAPAP